MSDLFQSHWNIRKGSLYNLKHTCFLRGFTKAIFSYKYMKCERPNNVSQIIVCVDREGYDRKICGVN